MNNTEITAHFTLQLCIILASCMFMARLVKRIGQPPVIGEMIAGVLLGPSLFGILAPDLQARVFPQDGPTMSILYTLSQIGLVLYMFIIGLEFDLDMVKRHAKAAATVAGAGLIAPLTLGIILTPILLADTGTFFAASVSTPQAALFLGAAIATTAFPMLARILSERGISGSSLGTLALTAGATTDAVSWILLATVVAVFHDDPRVAVVALTGGALYAVVLLTGGRRVLGRLIRVTRDHTGRAALSPSTLIVVLILILSASWYTNAVGIHSIFGGFILGVAMPRGVVVEQLTSWMEPLVKNLLLPLFFVYSGLNTQLGLLDSPTLWLITLGIITFSVLAKGGACGVAAWRFGLPKYEAVALGSLMNARGLIELILLNIGLQAGLITPTLFAVLVLMAVVTTLMASPIFDIAARRGNIRTTTTGPPTGTADPPALTPPDLVPVPALAGAASMQEKP